MADEWRHPELGRFQLVADRWEREMRVPAFDAFSFEPTCCESGQIDNRFELFFYAESIEDTPSDDMIRVAKLVLRDPARIVALVSTALWEDFNGRGSDSGMWWHGDLAEVGEALADEELPPPAGPEDVRKLLGLSWIGIRRQDERLGRPVAELSFGAAFEEEHGVGVLTDGERVVGIGYSTTVETFEGEG